MRALSIGATGMAAQEINVNVISNNIANMNTVGYKRQAAEFQDLLYQDMDRAGAQSSGTGTVVPTGIQIGSGVQTGSIYRINEQGAMTQTGNQLDMGINGQGYFQVLLPDGTTGYTRAGNFQVNQDGQLVTAQGYTVQPAITIPQGVTAVTVSPTGQVQVTQSGVTTPAVVGQIQLATFVNPAGLEATGNNLFTATAASGAAVVADPGSTGVGVLQQGYTEASNVDAVTEITNLISAQRAYEMNSKVVTTADQMLSTTSQLKS